MGETQMGRTPGGRGVLAAGAAAGFVAGMAGAAVAAIFVLNDVRAIKAGVDQNTETLTALGATPEARDAGQLPVLQTIGPEADTAAAPAPAVAGFSAGMIVAVDANACPPPWRVFRNADGRVLMGTGQVPGTETHVDLARPQGGVGQVRLSEANLPRHSHPFTSDLQLLPMYEMPSATTLHTFTAYAAQDRGEPLRPGTFESGDAGQAVPEPIPVVPPYRAVTFCIYPEDAGG